MDARTRVAVKNLIGAYRRLNDETNREEPPMETGSVKVRIDDDQLKKRMRDMLRQAKVEALREAADDIQALHPGEVKNSVIWLRQRANEYDHE